MARGDSKVAVHRILESSTAHGISHAAATKGTTMKVMWSLLFLVFLGLFLSSSVHLVEKLINNGLTKTYEMDATPFVFPDLFFCPSNPYSGSFPFNLTRDEADEVNAEVARLIDICRATPSCNKITENNCRTMAYLVQNSLPVHMSTRFMAHRSSQSVLGVDLISNSTSWMPVSVENFNHPENLVCMKPVLTEEHKQHLRSSRSSLRLWLSTDPYFPDFTYPGHPILPISDKVNRSLKFQQWHPIMGSQTLTASGFTMLMVPPGAYPSLVHEHSIQLAPGHAYKVKIDMEEIACHKQLWGTHCSRNQPNMALKNPSSGERVEFNYSYAACYYKHRIENLTKELGCQMPHSPSPWEFKEFPGCHNLSEITNATLEKLIKFRNPEFYQELELRATQICGPRVPCSYPRYSASFSFDKWPSAGSAVESVEDNYMFQVDPINEPATYLLVQTAKEMQLMGKNHSAHLEGVFRSYLTEALINVQISGASVMSSQVMMTWSYSVTAFLADTGGLLGLYIGCSLLTLCEVLEMLWIICSRHAPCRRKQPDRQSNDAEAVPMSEGSLKEASVR